MLTRMNKRNSTILIVLLISLVSIICICGAKGYSAVPDYRYGEDFYYTQILDDIVDEFPEYTKTSKEIKVGLLREYVYKKTMYAFGSNMCIDVYDQQVVADDLSEYVYNMLNLYNDGNPIGGFYCGGTSYTLTGLYNILGFDAVSMDMAVLDGDGNVMSPSHVITLVELDNKWIIEDACFNVEYRDEAGDLIDICTMLTYLDSNEDEKVICIEGNVSQKNVYLINLFYKMILYT